MGLGCFVDVSDLFLSHLPPPLHCSAREAQQIRAFTPLHSLSTFEVVVMLQLSPEQRHSHPLTHCTAKEFRLSDRLQREESAQTTCNLWFH